MNKRLLQLVIPLLLPPVAFSQSLAPSVVSAQGGYDRSEKIAVEWTLGENLTETGKPGDKVITQGFQQPFLKVRPAKKAARARVAVHPNPVDQLLNIQIKEDSSSTYVASLLRRDGVPMMSVTIPAGQSTTQIDMSSLPSGLYLLRIVTSSGTPYVTYRILKN